MKQLSGQDLKKMLISGANNLYNSYPEIDALNVFPVPYVMWTGEYEPTMTKWKQRVSKTVGDEVFLTSPKLFRGPLDGRSG